MNNPWPYPGSRWWKFDFHTHTPASIDTKDWNAAIGKSNEVTPKDWLLKFMAAKIDCVVVSDHNSGDWIDKLNTTYSQMKNDPSEEFRELSLFPGVELSVNSGFHLLAIFDTDTDGSKIDKLLGAVGYDGIKGDSNGVTRKSATEVIDEVLGAGGIPIPAHVDQKKGLLQLKKGEGKKSDLDPNTLRQILERQEIIAMEQIDLSMPLPILYTDSKVNWTSVLGSDCHSFRGEAVPGSRFTWVKMAKPCLEGLRLALVDGNNVSIRRSDESEHPPFETPEFFIESIEIDKARYMGNGTPQKMDFNPYMNALVGGRGTGKSTIIHALRLAFNRASDLKHLDSLRSEFERFKLKDKSALNEGALKSDTSIKAVVMRDGVRHRVIWNADDSIQVEDETSKEDFQLSQHQTVNPDRFPLRILSQGQVSAMADKGRRTLLDIIDEVAGIDEIQKRLKEAKSIWLTQRARLRELNNRLVNKSETSRKLTDVQKKVKGCLRQKQ